MITWVALRITRQFYWSAMAEAHKVSTQSITCIRAHDIRDVYIMMSTSGDTVSSRLDSTLLLNKSVSS